MNTQTELHGVDPRSGAVLSSVPCTSQEALLSMVAAAKRAQSVWASQPLRDRVSALRQVRARFLAESEAIVELLCQENGKPAPEAYTSEIVPNIGLFDYWLSEAPRLLAPQRVSLPMLEYPGKRGEIQLLPRGVVGLIAPWNYPVSIPLRTLLPALLAGNAVLFKPSEYAPRIGAKIAALFEGLLPEGLLAVVQGAGDIGAAVLEHVDHVVFTGSVATGKKVALRAAERLISTSLELGGKDAAIVLADADLERAAQGICWGAFSNAGQNCASVERVYVVKEIADVFVRRVVEIAKNIRLGQDMGPLCNERQRACVETQLSGAREAGAEVLCGGARGESGFYFQPTVVRLPEGPTVLETEETFGPVLPIRVVQSVEEAIEAANNSRYGLTASLWTRDLKRAEELAAQLSVGVVTINNHSFTAALPMAPWTGVRESGTGVTNSPRALEELCRSKFVLRDASSDTRELWWYPYNETLHEIGKALVMRAQGGMTTVRGLKKALSLLPKRFAKED